VISQAAITFLPVRVRRQERRDERRDERADQPPSAPVTFAVRTTDGQGVAVREESRFLAPNRPKG